MQPIMAHRGLCSPLWLNTALNGSYDPKTTLYGLHGSTWLFMAHRGLFSPLWLNTALNGSYGPKTTLYGQHGSTWLIMAHMAPKLLYMANMAQHGYLWLIGVYATHYDHVSHLEPFRAVLSRNGLNKPLLAIMGFINPYEP